MSTALLQLGWRSFFQAQLTLDEVERCVPVRVSEQHRSELAFVGENREGRLALRPDMLGLAVGDWILLEPEGAFHRALDRETVFQRKAPGRANELQTMVANVDTLFVVTSLNEDFNLGRIERYLTICHEAGSFPVIVLTKSDLCDSVESYVDRLRALDANLVFEVVTSMDPRTLEGLRSWCGPGQTTVLLGSSGVGKSTLLNVLLGEARQVTSGVRESDHKGRHTTTGRSLHRIPGGGVILDTPGMRELQLGGGEIGVEATFGDIMSLAGNCRFSDCAHAGEPGCAIQAAIQAGTLDSRRLVSYQKLQREESRHTATLAEQRAHGKSLGKLYKAVLARKRNERGRR